MNLLQLALDHPVYATAAFSLSALITAWALTMGRKLLSAAVAFLLGFIFVRKEAIDEYTMGVVVNYMKHTKARRWGFGRERYDATATHVNSKDGQRVVVKQVFTSSYGLFFWKMRPILLTPSSYSANAEGTKAAFTFLRWTVNWDNMLCEAAKLWDDTFIIPAEGTQSRYKVVRHTGSNGNSSRDSDVANKAPSPDGINMAGAYRLLNYQETDFWQEVEEPFEVLSVTPSMSAVIKTVKFWHEHRKWYKDRGLAWRRGYLLYGRAGDGKSSLVRAIAQDLDMPVHVFDLASMNNSELINAWSQSKNDRPRICLLEDFDNVFHGRTNVMPGSKLTFDAVLNLVDGVEREDGLLLFVTTNYVEHIDSALGAPDAEGKSTRPGRLDETIQLPGLDFEGRLKMARRILEDEDLAQRLSLEHGADTAAQFQERCASLALSRLWSA